VVESHGGQVVKRLGDGFMALFPDVTAAVPAAIAVREALRDNPDVGRPLEVRIGLHAAPVGDDRGDYYGAGVATAARVAERAAADQILLTDELAGRLPAGVPLTSAGQARLEGLPGRHRLHAVAG
jgi:adenylate cyclase